MGETTVSTVIDEGVEALRAAAAVPSQVAGRLLPRSTEQYRADITELVAYVLNVHEAELPSDALLPDEDGATVRKLIQRRADGIPLGYLTGYAMFRDLRLAVGPGVFVPRAESDLVVERGLRAIDDVPRPLIVDLCTGSGAVALACAHARPDATVHGVEIDPVAIDFARRNRAAQIALGDVGIVLHEADATNPELLSELDGRVDLLFALPPFMSDEDKPWIPTEVSEHQPAKAVFSGADGLDVTRAVVLAARRLLRPGGTVVIEHGAPHRDAVPAMLAAGGHFADISSHRDLDDWPLFAAGTRTAA